MSIINAYYSGFTNYVSGDYSISQWKTDDIENLPDSLKPEGKGKSKISFSVKGYKVELLKGVLFQLQGAWSVGKNGMIGFDLKSAMPVEPTGADGRIAYLSSGLIKGIGNKQAIAIEEKFGPDIFKILKSNPELLLSIPGIGVEKLKKVKSSYQKTAFVKELHELIGNEEISLQMAYRIYQTLGDRALERVKSNPYILVTKANIRFPIADAVAQKLNFSSTAKERIESAAEYVFSHYRVEGHLFLPQDFFFQELLKYLNTGTRKVTYEQTAEQVQKLCRAGSFVVESNNRIYPELYAKMEKETARKLCEMNHSPIQYDKQKYSDAVNKFLRSVNISLSVQQDRAIRFAMVKRAMIITGGPGTGKTTVLKGIIQSYRNANPQKHIFVLAPTGKAARRAAEATGEAAVTVDKMLYSLDNDEADEIKDAFQNGLVICDEMSMVDALKIWRLTSYFTANSHFVMVGDADQLSSVGPGDVLRQLVMSRCIMTIRLDTVYRQGEDSAICTNAHKINNGDAALIYNKEFSFVEAATDEQAESLMENIFLNMVKLHGYENVAMLTPRRKNSLIGAESMNKSIKKRLGIRSDKVVHANGQDFNVGDRIMETQNNDKANNGDVGTITGIIPYKEDDKLLYKIEILFDGNSEKVTYSQGDMATVTLVYSVTIHKSQGSEYAYVIIPIMESNKGMLKRNLLYTGVTRAKKGVVLVGQKDMVTYAVNSVDSGRRNTMLAEFLYRYEMEKRTQGEDEK